MFVWNTDEDFYWHLISVWTLNTAYLVLFVWTIVIHHLEFVTTNSWGNRGEPKTKLKRPMSPWPIPIPIEHAMWIWPTIWECFCIKQADLTIFTSIYGKLFATSTANRIYCCVMVKSNRIIKKIFMTRRQWIRPWVSYCGKITKNMRKIVKYRNNFNFLCSWFKYYTRVVQEVPRRR